MRFSFPGKCVGVVLGGAEDCNALLQESAVNFKRKSLKLSERMNIKRDPFMLKMFSIYFFFV
jgi:hypothetical protein